MERVALIIQKGPFTHKGPYKKEAGLWETEMGYDNGYRG